jgi:hypothetical protein
MRGTTLENLGWHEVAQIDLGPTFFGPWYVERQTPISHCRPPAKAMLYLLRAAPHLNMPKSFTPQESISQNQTHSHFRTLL